MKRSRASAKIRPPLRWRPLRAGEYAALSATLARAGLPVDDLESPGRLFFRFETDDDIPVGFGGLELHGDHALMRSIVTLPPVRRRGIGAAIVTQLELEARLHGCHAIWLLTTSAAVFFDRLGFAKCDRAVVPDVIRATREFADLCPQSAEVLMKRLL
jgi:arsenate reductase (glutaredoxin)